MKTAKILTIMVLVLGLMVCQAGVSVAAPMGTGFTYQGRLIDANQPADDLYDLQFKLFDANSDGNQIGGDVNEPDVDVIDGYFTVQLDFGSDVFNGDARWLEIGVRPGDLNDPNVYTTLSPRQEVTPTPYALQTRGIFVDNSGKVGIGTTSPSEKLEVSGNIGVNGLIRDNQNAGGAQTDALAMVYQLNNVLGDGTGDTEARIAFGNNGTGWSNGFDAYLAFQTYEQAYWANREVMRLTKGNVGIGTTSPTAKLDVNGQVRITGGSPGAGKVLTSDATGLATWQTAAGGADDDWAWSSGSGLTGDIYHTGNVGIGTTNPGYKLDVRGALRLYQVALPNQPSININEGGLGSGHVEIQAFGSTMTTHLLLQPMQGNVGIGTTTPAGKLDVNGSIYQRGAVLHADYVFEPGYKLESINEHSEFMWREKHLPAMPKIQKDENGQEIVEIGARGRGVVEELEKAHIYIEQIHKNINQLQEQNKKLQERISAMETIMNELPAGQEGGAR